MDNEEVYGSNNDSEAKRNYYTDDLEELLNFDFEELLSPSEFHAVLVSLNNAEYNKTTTTIDSSQNDDTQLDDDDNLVSNIMIMEGSVTDSAASLTSIESLMNPDLTTPSTKLQISKYGNTCDQSVPVFGFALQATFLPNDDTQNLFIEETQSLLSEYPTHLQNHHQPLLQQQVQEFNKGPLSMQMIHQSMLNSTQEMKRTISQLQPTIERSDMDRSTCPQLLLAEQSEGEFDSQRRCAFSGETNCTLEGESLTYQTNVLLTSTNNVQKVKIVDQSIIETIPQQHKHFTSGEKQFQCDIPKIPFSSDFNVELHKQSTHNVFQSGHQKNFSERVLLKQSKLIPTGKKPFQCDVCQKMLSRRTNLKRHELTHDAREKSFQCKMSENKFSRRDYLVKHIENNTGGKFFHCQICQKRFIKESNLNKHVLVHNRKKPYQCDICQKNFLQKAYLKKHERVHTGEKLFRCDLCQKRFLWKSCLKAHQMAHTRQKPFQCDVCQERFSQRTNLKNHERIHAEEWPFHCDICKRRFLWKSHLKAHLMTHSREKPFQCELCQKQFLLKSQLEQHNLVHIKKMLFQCDVCQGRFSSISYLKIHKMAHMGQKPFHCDVCQKSFSQNSNLMKHERVHTGEKPFQCNVCPKKFAQKSNWKRHEQIHIFRERIG